MSSSTPKPNSMALSLTTDSSPETAGGDREYDLSRLESKYSKEIDGFTYSCLGPIIKEEKYRVYFKRVEMRRTLLQQPKKGSAKKVKKEETTENGDSYLAQEERIVYSTGQKVYLHAPEDSVYLAEIISIFAFKNRPNVIEFEAKWFYAPDEAMQLTIVTHDTSSLADKDKKKKAVTTPSSSSSSGAIDGSISISNITFHSNEMLYANHKDDNDITKIKCPAHVLFLPSEYDLPSVWPTSGKNNKNKDNKLLLCRYRLELLGGDRACVAPLPMDKIQKEFRKRYMTLPLSYRQALERQQKWWNGFKALVMKPPEEETVITSVHQEKPTKEDQTMQTDVQSKIEPPTSKGKTQKSRRKSQDQQDVSIHDTSVHTAVVTPAPSSRSRRTPAEDLAMRLGLLSSDNKSGGTTTKKTGKSNKRERINTSPTIVDLTSNDIPVEENVELIVDDQEDVDKVCDIVMEMESETNHDVLEIVDKSSLQVDEEHIRDEKIRAASITELELCDPLVNLGHDEHQDMHFDPMEVTKEVVDMLLPSHESTGIINFTSFPDHPSISPETIGQVPEVGNSAGQQAHSNPTGEDIDYFGAISNTDLSLTLDNNTEMLRPTPTTKYSPNRKNWYEVVTVPLGEESRLLELLDFTKKTEELSVLLWYRQERVLANPAAKKLMKKVNNHDASVSGPSDSSDDVQYSHADHNLLTEKDFRFWKNHLTDDKLIPYNKIVHQLRKDFRASRMTSTARETGTAMTLLNSGSSIAGRKRSRSMSETSMSASLSSTLTGPKMLHDLAVASPAVAANDDFNTAHVSLQQSKSPKGSGGTSSASSGNKKAKKRFKNLFYSDEEEPSSDDNREYYFSAMTEYEETSFPDATEIPVATTRTTRKQSQPQVAPPQVDQVKQASVQEPLTARDKECIKNSAVIPALRSREELMQATALLIPSVPCYAHQAEKEDAVDLELYFTLAMKELNRLKREFLLSLRYPDTHAVLSYDEYMAFAAQQMDPHLSNEDFSMVTYFGDNNQPCSLRVDGSMVVARGDMLHIFSQLLYKNDYDIFAAIASLQSQILLGLSLWSLEEMNVLHDNYHRFGVHIHKFKQLLPKKSTKHILEYVSRYLQSSYKFDVLMNGNANKKSDSGGDAAVGSSESIYNNSQAMSSETSGVMDGSNSHHNSLNFDEVASSTPISSGQDRPIDMEGSKETPSEDCKVDGNAKDEEEEEEESVIASSPEYLSEEDEPISFDDMFDEEDFQSDIITPRKDEPTSIAAEQQKAHDRIESILVRFAAEFDEYSHHQLMSILIAWDKLFLTPAEFAIRISHLIYEATYIGAPLTLLPSNTNSQNQSQSSASSLVDESMAKEKLYQEWLHYRTEALKAKKSILHELRGLFPPAMAEKVLIIPDDHFFGTW